jgi:hypothetical protein
MSHTVQKTIKCVWTNSHQKELEKKSRNSLLLCNGGLVAKLVQDFGVNQTGSKLEKYKREKSKIFNNDISRALSPNEYYMKYYSDDYAKNLRLCEPNLSLLEQNSGLQPRDRMRMLDWMIEV